MLEDKEAISKEEGYPVREYRVMHEGNFLCSWLREDTGGKAGEAKERDRKDKEEEVKSGKRRG